MSNCNAACKDSHLQILQHDKDLHSAIQLHIPVFRQHIAVLIIEPKLTLWKDHTCSRWTSKLCKWKNRTGGSWWLLDWRAACRHCEGEVFHGWRYCSTWTCRQAVIQSYFLLSSTHHQVQETGSFTTKDQQEILQMIQALLGTYGIWPTSSSCGCVVLNNALPGRQQENWCQYSSTTAYAFP